MTGGLLNIVSYGNLNIIVNGNPKKSFFSATFKKYTNFGLQKHKISTTVTNKQLDENNSTIFAFDIPRWGDLINDTFFILQMPHIWSPIWIEPSSINSYPGQQPINGKFEVQTTNTSIYWVGDASDNQTNFPPKIVSPTIPYCQPYEFKWIENLGCQIIKKIKVTIGGNLIQEYTGDYLQNMIKRGLSKEKLDLFNNMTGNTNSMNNPAYSGVRNGIYPNCLYGSIGTKELDKDNWDRNSELKNMNCNSSKYYFFSIYNNSDINTTDINNLVNLTPSINKKQLIIPLNVWYMLSSTQAFPLIGLTSNKITIEIECRAIRELFVVRDIRTFINNYYAKSFAIGNRKLDLTGESIYKDLSNNYYNNYTKDKEYSQFNIFMPYVPPPYISTIDTTDPLFQLYIFTKQFASINQAYLQEAAIQSTVSANVSSRLRSSSNWNINPELIATYTYLDIEEQRVFRNKKQSYLIKQIQEFDFQKSYHTKYGKERIKTSSIISNWMWFLRRSDANLRNEWSNYSNWAYKSKDYTLQLLYHSFLSDPIKNDISWNPRYLPTANPDPDFSIKPLMYNVVTANTEPKNFRYNNYALDSKYNKTWCKNEIGGIKPGAMAVGSVSDWKMHRNIPYFPFSYKIPTDTSINVTLPYITGPLRNLNKNILNDWEILLAGKNRENTIPAEYYNLVEPFLRTSGSYINGLYTYSFSLNTNPYIIEPNGAMDMNKFSHIDFTYSNQELLSINDISRVAILPLCDSSNNILGYNKTSWEIFEYSFDLKVMQENYNILSIDNGLAYIEILSN